MTDPCYCDLREVRPHTWNPKKCPAPLMFKRQRRAIQKLWDALSEILETPHSTVRNDLRSQGNRAIAEARRAFPEES